MAAIHSKDTKPEMIVRRGLWKRGFRYRLNHKRLPGHPDLVLRKYRTCIFVNGCFWHGHNVMYDVRCKTEEIIESSECCKIPKTNRDFWVAKIRRNKERDKEEQRKLAEMGWHCITVWECELKPSKRDGSRRRCRLTGCLLQLSATIRKILNSSDNCDEQGVLLYTQSPHQVLKCGDLVFEHLVKQLEVVVVDDGEVLGIANQMEAPIDLKTGFNWHEKKAPKS